MPIEQRITAARLFGICLLVTIIGYWIPLWHGDLTTGYDWDLFSAYSLVLRSLLLVYHQLPLHDPWVCGGLDLLANPQTRMFSPMYLVDLLFAPYTSDLVSLMIYGFFGMFGMYFLLRERRLSKETALVGAILFIHNSWFGLHFVEGHITFGSMQLLPWVLYFALKIEEPREVFGLLSLMALFVLDGAIYTAIFSAMMLLAAAGTGLIMPSRLFRDRRMLRPINLISLIAVLLLVSIKVVPILLLSTKIEPVLDFTQLRVSELVQILFNPLQRHLSIATKEAIWRFHEFGCYLSPVAIGLVLFQFRSTRFIRRNSHYLILIGLFFWLASGWGGDFNPWNLYQRIPLFNIAHVQSRLFILMDLFFVMLVAEAVEQLKSKRGLWALCLSFLAIEAMFVNSYPFYFGFLYARPRPEIGLIAKTEILGIKNVGAKPDLYFNSRYAVVHTYEAAAPETRVLSEDDPAYRGLVYVLDGQGNATLESYTPGRIEIGYSTRDVLTTEIDSNYLGGWVVESGAAHVHSNPNGLIGLDLAPGSGNAVLRYRPSYLRYVVPAFGLGLLLWVGLAISLLRSSRRQR